MKIDFKTHAITDSDNVLYPEHQEVAFSIVGRTYISDKKLKQKSGTFVNIVRTIILEELDGLITLELYGRRVISNEPEETSGDKPKPDSKTSQTDGGNDFTSNASQTKGGKRPITGSHTPIPTKKAKAKKPTGK